MNDGLPAVLPLLERGTVHVFWFATDLPARRLEPLERLLDPADRARADRFRFARDRNRFIAARGRLRTLLGHYRDSPPAQLAFDTGPHGKPALRPASGGARIQFNLSRSDGIGVAAIGLEEELGIDVERIRPIDDAPAIAERMFTSEERQALRAVAPGLFAETFFRYWTRKEAIVKSLGWGLSHPLDRFALGAEWGGAERIQVDADGAPAVWVLPVPLLREGCAAALATSGPLPAVRSLEWQED